jgi:hypothetical protein
MSHAEGSRVPVNVNRVGDGARRGFVLLYLLSMMPHGESHMYRPYVIASQAVLTSLLKVNSL